MFILLDVLYMVKDFREFEVWKKGKLVVSHIYRITWWWHFDKDWWLRDQMRRASISVISNIAEWYNRNSKKEFSRFLRISKWSTAELIAQTEIAYMLEYIHEEDYTKIINELNHLVNMFGKFISTLS